MNNDIFFEIEEKIEEKFGWWDSSEYEQVKDFVTSLGYSWEDYIYHGYLLYK